MNSLAARRRHPAAIVVILMLGLLATGGLYALLSPKTAQAAVATADDAAQGKKLFLANCATCHGLKATGTADGPSLVGVGAAAVDFQVGTGRMPLAGPDVQAHQVNKLKYSDEEIRQLGAFVATLGPGPAVPEESSLTGGNPAKGGELFRVNCAMCHNFTGAGGALTRGKFAPALNDISGKHIYEAMVTGPQSMPVFNNQNVSVDGKKDIVAYLHTRDENKNPGGLTLGRIGPVNEGLFVWTFGIGILIGFAVWLGRKAA